MPIEPAARTIGERKGTATVGLECQLAKRITERVKQAKADAVDYVRRAHATAFLLSARRTALGSALMISMSVRAAPEGLRVPSSHFRTVPTPVPISDANSRCDRPSLLRASRAS